MGVLVRAVITGFGLSLGAAIYKQVEKRLGIAADAEAAAGKVPSTVTRDGGAPATPAMA